MTQQETTTTNRGGSEASILSIASTSDIDNGSFEKEFKDWQTIGDTSIETSDLGIFPTDGKYQALITTGYSDAGGSVTDLDLEKFLDLNVNSLDGLVAGNAFEGSAIKQTIDLKANDVVSFDWNFLTNENTPDKTFNDTAFLSVNGSNFELADTGSKFVDALKVDEFDEQTGTKTLTFQVKNAGTYTLGFGVVDVGDAIVDSGLVIDNIEVKSYGLSNNYSALEGSKPDLILGDDGFTSTMTSGSGPDLVLGEKGFETV